MAKELHFLISKRAFLFLYVQLMFTEHLEDLFKMLHMLLEIATIHHNIIEIDYHELIKEMVKYPIHERAKGGRSISETEGHDQELKSFIMNDTCSLLYIPFCNLYLIVSSISSITLWSTWHR